MPPFHPIIEQWFASRFDAPTEPQARGWPAIANGEQVLIAAPTGSGKTLTAFLAVIDRLLKRSLKKKLSSGIRVVYVSPLRALSNDMHRNLEVPLREITELVAAADIRRPDGEKPDPIRVGLRTGDTSSSQRATLVRKPPHILVTTPESLFLLLTSAKGRAALKKTETVIVDEIHALVRDKRGSHLALSLERLQALCKKPLQRIGLSATQRPIERMAEFLVGSAESRKPKAESRSPIPDQRSLFGSEETDFGFRLSASGHRLSATIVDVGHARNLDLAIEVPQLELSAVCSHEHWGQVNARVVELINSHRSTLIFVNTRRMAERVAHQLTELLGEDHVSSHHGSLSADLRLRTERRLKSGDLKAVVATASLELGIDIGYIDLVIQLGSPGAIATFLQRIGRAGHAVKATPKGRLFALTRDELVECMALIRAVKAGRLDVIPIPVAPLDVLAQQIVAEVAAADEWSSDELFETFRRAYPYREMTREQFDAVVQIMAEGITDTSGRGRVYLHHDRVKRRLKARPGARIAATSNAGAIPDIGSYRVVADPDGVVVGTIDEDFAVESQRGDIFLLGSTSWRFQGLRGLDVVVTDAGGAPPTIPFWRGEAPGRSWELSEEVSRLRGEIASRLVARTPTSERPDVGVRATGDSATDWLQHETNCDSWAAEQIVNYIATQQAAIGIVPDQTKIVFERFFDESGGMQMVVHAPFGARVCKAWGLAMRKRFCRSFDFELQATADDDGFILSLGPQHSFPLESMFPMLNRENARNLLEQAILQIPLFQTRWRWNMNRALLVLRMRNGSKVPPALQRFRSDDLLTAVFPKLTGCQENIVGDHELPDHPLITQTMHDCLTEALDLDGLHRVLESVAAGKIEFIARDTREPSPFCYELLNANPYAFLDGGEIQERRARAVANRRSLTPEDVRDLAKLDPLAIEQVVREAQPLIRNADELHDALLSLFVMPIHPKRQRGRALHETHESALSGAFALADASGYFTELAADRRATTIALPNGDAAWVAAERLPAVRAMFATASIDPVIEPPAGVRLNWETTEARVAMLRGWLEISGPITVEELAEHTSLTESQVAASLEALEGEGIVLRGAFREPRDSGGTSLTSGKGVEVPSNRDSHALPAGQSVPPGVSITTPPEWCHRRLLARIHRLTIEGLRKAIEPVDVATYWRYLARRHGITGTNRRTGSNGLFEVIAMLQGLDLPAVAWERDILPARIEHYRPEFLDELCLGGEVGWARLYPPQVNPDKSKPMSSVTRVVPVSLFLRSDADWLTPQGDSSGEQGGVSPAAPSSLMSSSPNRGADAAPLANFLGLSGAAADVLSLLQRGGAMFLNDLARDARLLPDHLEDALGELVSRGLITSDGFAGLRYLIRERSQSNSLRSIARRPSLIRQRGATSSSGRWAMRASRESQFGDQASTVISKSSTVAEQWAWQLLRRWGVVFKDLLARESGTPSWYELLQVYRRLEARGEIRGGRFIAGVAGEQFSMSESIRQLRLLRDGAASREHQHDTGNAVASPELVLLSASDPLNLVGILDDLPRVPSVASHRLVYLNGRCVGTKIADQIWLSPALPDRLAACVTELLERGASGMFEEARPSESASRPCAAAAPLRSARLRAK